MTTQFPGSFTYRTYLSMSDPEFGARPVKRVIHRYVLNQLSKDLLAQKVDKSKPIVIDADTSGLVFRN